MRLGYVIIYVPDVAATVDFYERAFGIQRRFVHESGYAEIETGATALAFASESLIASNGVRAKPNRPSDVPVGAEIAFVTDDVEGAYVRDNNGFLVEIGSPVGDN